MYEEILLLRTGFGWFISVGPLYMSFRVRNFGRASDKRRDFLFKILTKPEPWGGLTYLFQSEKNWLDRLTFWTVRPRNRLKVPQIGGTGLASYLMNGSWTGRGWIVFTALQARLQFYRWGWALTALLFHLPYFITSVRPTYSNHPVLGSLELPSCIQYCLTTEIYCMGGFGLALRPPFIRITFICLLEYSQFDLYQPFAFLFQNFALTGSLAHRP